MNNAPDDDRVARARRARQVIAGSEIRPPSSSLSSTYVAPHHWLTPAQRTYLILVGVLLLLGVLLYLIFSLGIASIVLFLLALTLLAGWLVF